MNYDIVLECKRDECACAGNCKRCTRVIAGSAKTRTPKPGSKKTEIYMEDKLVCILHDKSDKGTRVTENDTHPTWKFCDLFFVEDTNIRLIYLMKKK